VSQLSEPAIGVAWGKAPATKRQGLNPAKHT